MNIAQADGVKGSEETLKRKGRTKLGCCLMGCASPVGLILLLVVVFFVWRAQSVAAIKQIEAEITARGEPLNVEEVNRRYRQIGKATSKTLRFEDLFEKLTDEKLDASSLPLPIVGIAEIPEIDPESPWQQEQEVADFLTEHAALIDELEAAALAEGEVRFIRDFRKGMFIESAESSSRLVGYRLISLRAKFAAHVGDSDQTFRSLLAMYRLAQSMHAEPSSGELANRVAIHGVANDLLAESMPFVDWSNEQIEQLLEECLIVDWRKQLATSFARKQALGRSHFKDPNAIESFLSGVPAVNRFEDERFYMEYMMRCLRATDQPFPELLVEIRRIDDQVVDNFTKGSKIDKLVHELSYALISLSTIRAQSAMYARAEAIDQATAAQLAIELYQRKHGQPPAKLSDLVPQYLPVEPIDPFNRLPLKYLVTDTEIIVSTVGGDDLESVMETDEDGRPLEYTLRVPRR